ncbi:hypothetical protein DFH08DRAFT_810205 [Mycena albidolilacea]|uniref:Uncharacterized protein n=1 Tax=Mycena albidolilacea TaxID=1033008 RepID=A0AAD6ZZF4_9AGAR|nr:hypothetical protein DFH08DRAFT_810205 [Mycena albidolilacea]
MCYAITRAEWNNSRWHLNFEHIAELYAITSHSAAKWLVSGMSTKLDHWDALFHSISTPGLPPAQWRAQAILPDGINLGRGVACKEFTAVYQFISLSTEYEFWWFECTDGTVYQSEHSILPPKIL